MNKMFTYQGKRLKTWNPFTGCNFNCSYCWARKLAEGKLKNSYPNGFIPTTHPDDFIYIPSLPRDNPYLPKGYEEELRKMYPEELVKAWLDGDWIKRVNAMAEQWG